MRPLALLVLLALSAPASANNFTLFGVGGNIPDPAATPGTWATSTYTGTAFTSTIFVPNPVASLTSVQLSNLNHSYRGDLHVLLKSPNGLSYNLVVRPGFTGANFGDSGDYLLGNYLLVSSGGANVAQGATDISGGSYNLHFNSGAGMWGLGSNVSFASIAGPSGNWTLEIRDWAPQDTGSLTGWALSGTDTGTWPEFCAGDGSVSCPCGNLGGAGRGCQNSAGTGGGKLVIVGQNSPDTILLGASGLLPSALAIFLQGDGTVAGGIPFGDGTRCIGGLMLRLYQRNAITGVVSAPQVGEPSITARCAALGNPISPGSTRYYQVYYRDPSPGFCPDPTGSTFNITNAAYVNW